MRRFSVSTPEQRLEELLRNPAAASSMTGDIVYSAGLAVRAWIDCQQALMRERAARGPEQEQAAAHDREQKIILFNLAMRALQMAFLIPPTGTTPPPPGDGRS